MKLFELSTSARKASQEVHLSYKTTLRAYDILRSVFIEELAKTDELLKGEWEADEAKPTLGESEKGKRGRCEGGKTIVYGILERGGRASLSIVQDGSAGSLMTEDGEEGKKRLHRVHR